MKSHKHYCLRCEALKSCKCPFLRRSDWLCHACQLVVHELIKEELREYWERTRSVTHDNGGDYK
jgi:hypothetical protein